MKDVSYFLDYIYLNGATAGMEGHDIRNPFQATTGDVYLAKTNLNSFPDSPEKQKHLGKPPRNRKEHRLHQQNSCKPSRFC
jgi:hypothetical protein